MATNKEQFLALHGLPLDTSLSAWQMSVLSDMPEEALLEVYRRGSGAWRSSISSVRLRKDFSKNPDTKKYPRGARLSKEHWAAARVYAFLMKTDKVFYGADKDIAEKYGLL
jgi:hypothetical protein